MEHASDGIVGGSASVHRDDGEGRITDHVASSEDGFSEFLRNLNTNSDRNEFGTPLIEPSDSGHDELQSFQPETLNFDGFDFQNTLRHSALQRNATLPDFP